MEKNKEELKEEELKDIAGARNDITIKPDFNGDNFWHSFNPNFINSTPNNLGLINDETKNNIKIDDVKFNGSLANRDDKE